MAECDYVCTSSGMNRKGRGGRLCDSRTVCLQVHTEVSNMGIANNDDKILHCCLLYQMKVKGQYSGYATNVLVFPSYRM